MVMCLDCRLVQLESDPTTPEEPHRQEPRALLEQAEAAIADAGAQGYLQPGIRFLVYPSPHGGSWVEQLERRALVEVSDGPADLLIDIFGMMHDADQRAALTRRVSRMSPDAILLMQFHTVAAIVRSHAVAVAAQVGGDHVEALLYAWRRAVPAYMRQRIAVQQQERRPFAPDCSVDLGAIGPEPPHLEARHEIGGTGARRHMRNHEIVAPLSAKGDYYAKVADERDS